MTIGFIGLGNLGGKLAASLQRNDFGIAVHDLDRAAASLLEAAGAAWAGSAAEAASGSELVITCLPSPTAVRDVMEGPDGVLSTLGPGQIWIEMSTTDRNEVVRLGAAAAATGAGALDAPVSGGCHRAATGNISIFVGGERSTFAAALPALQAMGRQILHTGALGSASVLKVITNYLASTHLAALGEALTTAAAAGMDLATTYEAIRISSGNSFVHETESQLILNGSFAIDFTMELVAKDMALFTAVADEAGVPLELAPAVQEIFQDGVRRYGPSAWSSSIVRRLEETCDLALRAPGFPAVLVDTEPEVLGSEVPRRSWPNGRDTPAGGSDRGCGS